MHERLRWLHDTASLLTERRFSDFARALSNRQVADKTFPRPVRRRHRPASLRLTHVLVSSDLNRRYLDCWPLARRAWKEVAGLEPVLVLVADERDVSDSLRADHNVYLFPPSDTLHTALQAQCIRLLYPALLDAEGVITSDIDMVPLNSTYFHRPSSSTDSHQFLVYRNALLASGEIPMCYNAARPETWADIFGVGSLDDARARLLEWGSGLRYDGIRGGQGWDTDQIVLFETLLERGKRVGDVWILDDRFSGHRRLVLSPQERGGPAVSIQRRIKHGWYSDFHLMHPIVENEAVNTLVVELARTRVDKGART